jgi:hypothetical protein
MPDYEAFTATHFQDITEASVFERKLQGSSRGTAQVVTAVKNIFTGECKKSTIMIEQ